MHVKIIFLYSLLLEWKKIPLIEVNMNWKIYLHLVLDQILDMLSLSSSIFHWGQSIDDQYESVMAHYDEFDSFDAKQKQADVDTEN